MASQAVISKAEDIGVFVDGKSVEFDVAPAAIDGRTMVPLRAIFEAMGAVVEYNPNTKEIISKKDSTVVKMTLGSKTLEINGEKQEMDVCPVVIDNRTLVPARYAAESFNAVVQWDAENSDVLIFSRENLFLYEGTQIPDIGGCLGIEPESVDVDGEYTVVNYKVEYTDSMNNNLYKFAYTCAAYGYKEVNTQVSNTGTYSEFVKDGQTEPIFTFEVKTFDTRGIEFILKYKNN